MGVDNDARKKVTGISICELFTEYKCSVEGDSLILTQRIVKNRKKISFLLKIMKTLQLESMEKM